MHVKSVMSDPLHYTYLQSLLGATRTPEAKELTYARQKVVTITKAFRLQAIDLVHIDYKGKNILTSEETIPVINRCVVCLKKASFNIFGVDVVVPQEILAGRACQSLFWYVTLFSI